MPETEQAVEPDTAPVSTSGVTPPPPEPEPAPRPTAPTSATSWKSALDEGFLQTLPSGNVARLRRTLDLLVLMKSGQIPNPLMNLVNDMITGKRKELKMQDVEPEKMVELLKLVDRCLPGIFIEPKLAAPPEELDIIQARSWKPEDEDTISLLALDQQDRMFAFAFAQGAVSDLTSFRERQAEDVDELPDVPPVPHISVPSDGPGE